MRRLAWVVAVLGIATGTAFAQGVDETPATDDTAADRPGNLEAGVFLGGFISNYYQQFYSPDIQRMGPYELDRVNPEFGGRLAVFLTENLGIEGEGSVIMASTKAEGDSAVIYGLGAQAVIQKPGRITPYLGLGISLRHLSSDDGVLGSDTDFPVHASLGARYFISPSVALRADVRFLRGPSYPHDNSYTLNASYGEFSLGVSFNPGAKKDVVIIAPPPDPDPDHDGIIGSVDQCPTEPSTNPDGCPTRDTDGDGIADAADKCVDQAETVNQWEDSDGCPDVIPDTDSDGFNDLADKCKDQPEDMDSFQDDDGCPDPDNDGDGVLDGKDRCPSTAGVVENSGCPDTDGDGDGIVDRLDNCPEEKGSEKNFGCKMKQLVVLTKDQLKILDQVKFVSNSAKLSGASNRLLDNIARVLLAHPDIWKVRIEGHTDNVGDPGKNLKLSQERANAVVAYLVRKGVAPERLEAQGFGDTKPIEDNTTAKGKAQNRRVEFNILTE